VISEVCRDDGEMARMPDLEAFGREHGLRICSVEQIIHHRLGRERLVRRLPPAEGIPVDTDQGRFTVIAYRSVVDRLPHLAFCVGDVGRLDPAGHPVETDEPTLVRMHRRDLLGDVFGDKSYPSNRVLGASLARVQAEGHGVLVYLRPEGAGEGLAERFQSWMYPSPIDTAETEEPDLFGVTNVRAAPMSRHDFGIGGQILRDLGLRRLRVLSNNPIRLHHLQAFGLEVVETVPISL
jgi:3,4-dihydroxy 2-butanone 4-phosphate synthase/GTP cyclohydrolase II